MKMHIGIVNYYDRNRDIGIISARGELEKREIVFGMVSHCRLVSNGNGSPAFGDFGGKDYQIPKQGTHVVFELGELAYNVAGRWGRFVDFQDLRQTLRGKTRTHQSPKPTHIDNGAPTSPPPPPQDQAPAKPAYPAPATIAILAEPPANMSPYAIKRWRRHRETLTAEACTH